MTHRRFDGLSKITLLMMLMLAGCNSTNLRYEKLARGFKDPGNEARPRAYWNWLNGDVTHAGLTRDLEEAKAKGLAGLKGIPYQRSRDRLLALTRVKFIQGQPLKLNI